MATFEPFTQEELKWVAVRDSGGTGYLSRPSQLKKLVGYQSHSHKEVRCRHCQWLSVTGHDNSQRTNHCDLLAGAVVCLGGSCEQAKVSHS